MDDIAELLGELLSGADETEETSDGSETTSNSMPDLGALMGLFSGGGGQKLLSGGKETEDSGDGGFNFADLLGDIDIGMILKIMSILSKLNSNKDDKNTKLLLALKPHLKEESRHKADEAAKIMQLLSILPVLQQEGILSDVLGQIGL